MATEASKKKRSAIVKKYHEDNPEHRVKWQASVCTPEALAKHRKAMSSEEMRKKMSDRNLGEKCPNSKLTEKEVLEIRAWAKLQVYHSFLAKKYGVDVVTIGTIVRRKTWKHI